MTTVKLTPTMTPEQFAQDIRQTCESHNKDRRFLGTTLALLLEWMWRTDEQAVTGERVPAPDEPYLTVEQAARYLNTSIWTIYRMKDDGDLPRKWIGGRYKFRRAELDAANAKRKIRPRKAQRKV